ncbi:MAG: formylglycine-generating enzyme family protein [Planctomycetia bacterium]
MHRVDCTSNRRHRLPGFHIAALLSALAVLPLQADEPAAALKDLPKDFQPYTEALPGFDLPFKMTPIPGGTFLMGSPADEPDRLDDEGPQVEVKVDPFWMGVHEVTWEQFDVFSFSYDVKQFKTAVEKDPSLKATDADKAADAVTRPTPPYVDMTFGYGHDGYPAICMTQHAAHKFTEWLSAKTGKKYRLPTEAEWEFASRAGAKTQFSFGDDRAKLGDYAWFFENANDKPQPVGKKKPNPFGLYDIHGNVSEWTADKYVDDYFKRIGDAKPVVNPLLKTDDTVWHAARGGSWQDDAGFLRSAVRRGAEEDWSIQDPQIPKSIWWHTDAHFVGLRVVRSYQPQEKK